MRTFRSWRVRMSRALSALAAIASGLASGASLVSFTPQGELMRVRQVVARFDAPMVPLGDPRLPAPFAIACAEAGESRWVDERTWTYSFERDVPAGVRCSFELQPGLQTLAGEPVSPRVHAFSTGGPRVLQTFPYPGARDIAEDTPFVLRLNVAATRESVERHVQCRVGGQPRAVEVIEGEQRSQLLARHGIREEAGTNHLALRCVGRFEPLFGVEIAWSAGVASAGGAITTQPQSFRYTVRGPLTARHACTSFPWAGGACDPQSPIALTFSAPVPRAALERLRLRLPDGSERLPEIPAWTGAFGTTASFRPPFPFDATVTLAAPGDVRDDSGRALSNAYELPLRVQVGEPRPAIAFPIGWPYHGVVERLPAPSFRVIAQNTEARLPMRRWYVPPGPLGARADADALFAVARQLALGWRLRDGRPIDPPANPLAGWVEPATGELARRGPSVESEVLPLDVRAPGVHVIELESAKAAQGRSGSDARVTHAGVVVTNLALHFKRGPENALAWVTTLDRARAVAGAEVVVRDCDGRLHWQGTTDDDGVARIPRALPRATCANLPAVFVAARAGDDIAWVWEGRDGIGAFAPGVQTYDPRGGWSMHTVLDRTLFRAGETVAMKHHARQETLAGLAAARGGDDASVAVVHAATRQSWTLPGTWQADGVAANEWAIPADAKLGTYQVVVTTPGEARRVVTATFRVEAFRLPVLVAEVRPAPHPRVDVRELPVDVRLAYLSGGPARQGVSLRSQLRARPARFPGFEAFVFSRIDVKPFAPQRVGEPLKAELDASGAARFTVAGIPALDQPVELVTEMELVDPNGETQTASATTPLWPADVVVGLGISGLPAPGSTAMVQAVVLDVDGQRRAGARVTVDAVLERTRYERVPVPGGGYRHEARSETRALGTVCEGATDAYGLLACPLRIGEGGTIRLTARTNDAAGRTVQASRNLFAWSYSPWLPPNLRARVEVATDKRTYAPGETLRVQIGAPFQRGTALVTVEREGVADVRRVEIVAGAGTIELPVRASYAPNMYVGVIAVSGRDESVATTEDDDLGKPGIASGVAEVQVMPDAFRLDVRVATPKEVYRTRDRVRVTIRATRPDGSPAARADVAVAAVDEALLQLRENATWDLLAGMLARRSFRMLASSSQMRLIERRTVVALQEVAQAGRLSAEPRPAAKPAALAAPAPAAEASGPPRELFDTLLLWRASLALDDDGEATIEVPLNDSLSSFRIVAIAAAGAAAFGTGSTVVRSSKPLQVFSGLPPLVREGDAYAAAVTLRNTSPRPMRVALAAHGQAVAADGRRPPVVHRLAADLAAGESREMTFDTNVPAGAERIDWTIEARADDGESDALKLAQEVVPAVPVRVLQATIVQLDRRYEAAVALPRAAVRGRGGVRVDLQARLADSLEPVREHMRAYPYICLEQKVSRSIALGDDKAWDELMRALPAYLDGDGLAAYFPRSAQFPGEGSDVLTSYLVAVAHEARRKIPPELLERMLKGLEAFAAGRVVREHWSPRDDLVVRRLAALEALSRHRTPDATQLGAIEPDPNGWPTSAVIDWLGILARLPASAARPAERAAAEQVLRARLDLHGTTLNFSSERTDHWWWLMAAPDVNAVRLLLLVMDREDWRDDLPRLARGALARQKQGTWMTTVANVWGLVAFDRFGERFERARVGGRSRVTLAGASRELAWTQDGRVGAELPWPAAEGRLAVVHAGTGRPWLTVQSRAAIPLQAPFASGYQVRKTLTPVEQKSPGQWRRGDVARVTLEIDAQSDMTWVVVDDPVPAGATILGSGLGRDSAILGQPEPAAAGQRLAVRARPTYVERTFGAHRVYYAVLPKGRHVVEYTVRLNNGGTFAMPPTRVEAMYAPEMFGEWPNPPMIVRP